MYDVISTGTATRSCRTRKRAIISVSPIYCDNVDMLTHHYSLGLIYTHPARAASLVRPVAAAAVAAECALYICTAIFVIKRIIIN